MKLARNMNLRKIGIEIWKWRNLKLKWTNAVALICLLLILLSFTVAIIPLLRGGVLSQIIGVPVQKTVMIEANVGETFYIRDNGWYKYLGYTTASSGQVILRIAHIWLFGIYSEYTYTFPSLEKAKGQQISIEETVVTIKSFDNTKIILEYSYTTLEIPKAS